MNKYDNRYLMLQEEKLTQIIEKQKKITAVALEFNVSRQTVHKWLNRYRRFGADGLRQQKRRNPGRSHNRTSPEVEQLVANLARQHYYDGVETLSDRLQAENNLTLHPDHHLPHPKEKRSPLRGTTDLDQEALEKTIIFSSDTRERTANGH